jgi:hypothetical protein
MVPYISNFLSTFFKCIFICFFAFYPIFAKLFRILVNAIVMEYPGSNPEDHDITNKLICVEYPGVVKNENAMLKSLGGLRAVSSVRYSLKLFVE